MKPFQLVNSDFDLRNVTVKRCCFKNAVWIEYSAGRPNHLLHWVLSGKREYEVGERRFTVEAGAVLLIPRGTVYRTRSFEECEGVGICFEAEASLDPDVYSEWEDPARVAELFGRMEALYSTRPAALLPLKLTLFKLLYGLVSSSEEVGALHPAVELIGRRYAENLPVSVYAAACNMSESYFRRRFTEAMGMSPIAYRNELRFNRAEQLVRQGETLQAMAEQLGFYDAGTLCKQYKKVRRQSLKKNPEWV